MSETCLKTQVLGVTSRTYPPQSSDTRRPRDASDSVPSRSLSLHRVESDPDHNDHGHGLDARRDVAAPQHYVRLNVWQLSIMEEMGCGYACKDAA